uniref:Uncharacterized protein n=2 Tax=Caenorhabditis japonica TaxID=281687 RepID=A0A8R1EN80_CAEJA
MSAAAYFVLAGAGFWSEKFDAEQPLLVRRSRSTITELFANYDYHGDFENVTETVTPKRELIRVNIRNPNFQKIPSPIEIPMRPLAEIIFNDSPDHDHDSSKHQPTRNEKSEEEQLSESKEDRSEAVSCTKTGQ